MKLYKVVVDISSPDDFVVVAESEEKAVDCVRPLYLCDIDEDDVTVYELSDLTEEFVYEERAYI